MLAVATAAEKDIAAIIKKCDNITELKPMM